MHSKRRESASYWYPERRECVVFKICFSAQTRFELISMTEVPRQLIVKTRTIVPPPHKLASKGEAGREIYRPWVIAAGRFTVRWLYTPRAPGFPQHDKNLLANAINRAPVGQAPCTFCQQRLPHTLRSSSVHIGSGVVPRGFEKTFSR